MFFCILNGTIRALKDFFAKRSCRARIVQSGDTSFGVSPAAPLSLTSLCQIDPLSLRVQSTAAASLGSILLCDLRPLAALRTPLRFVSQCRAMLFALSHLPAQRFFKTECVRSLPYLTRRIHREEQDVDDRRNLAIIRKITLGALSKNKSRK